MTWNEKEFKARKKLTPNEKMCLWYYKMYGDKCVAYMKAFPTNNRHYALIKSRLLLNTERAEKFLEKIMNKAMKDLGVDDRYILRQIMKAIEEEKGVKRVPGIQIMTEYTGLGEANKKLLPAPPLGGLIDAGEIQITDAEEVEEEVKKIEVHHGDIVSEDVPPGVGQGQDPK